MTDIELLPLPEVLIGRGKTAAEAWCRANVAHVTAAKGAEIEALRAEVGEWKAIATWEKEQHDRLFKEARALNERAERLAEALRKIEKDAPDKMPDLDAWSDADEKAEMAENLVHWHLGQIARDALLNHEKN